MFKDIRFINKNYPKYSVDFYIPSIKLIIEYNGAQHYRPVCFNKITIEEAENNFKKQQIRDKNVNEICKNNNIPIMWIGQLPTTKVVGLKEIDAN